MPPAVNGRHPREPAPSSEPVPSSPTASDAVDFLVEAEAMRDALTEAARRAVRLVGSLRQLQRQRKVLATAWSSLKNLRLGS